MKKNVVVMRTFYQTDLSAKSRYKPVRDLTIADLTPFAQRDCKELRLVVYLSKAGMALLRCHDTLAGKTLVEKPCPIRQRMAALMA